MPPWLIRLAGQHARHLYCQPTGGRIGTAARIGFFHSRSRVYGRCGGAVWVVFGELRLAIAVSGALLVSGGLATTLGLLLPSVLMRLGQDPALGSGPLATVFQDVLTLLVYFAFIAVLY